MEFFGAPWRNLTIGLHDKRKRQLIPYLFLAVEPGSRVAASPAVLSKFPQLERLAAGHGGRFTLRPKENANVFFDGIGVFGDRLVRCAADLAPDALSGRGNYMLARDQPALTSIDIDPLGYYPVFYYDDDGIFCAGNRAAALAELLEGLGRPLHRDLTVFGWFTVLGSAPGALTGYRELRLLERGCTLRIGPDNRVSMAQRPDSDLFYAPQPLPDLLDEAAAEVAQNVRTLVDGQFDYNVCELTGGMDSRVVAAAVIGGGLKDKFLFHTIGSYPSPDANVAAAIRKQFGLARAVNVHPSNDDVPSPLDRLRTSVGAVNGLLSTYFGTSTRPRPFDMLIIGGGSGEIMRQFFSSRADAPLEGPLRNLPMRAEHLAPATECGFIEEFHRFARNGMHDGIRPEHLGDLLYLSTRAKYHFGVWWANSAVARFHPLYSPALICASHALPDARRAANGLGFELIRRFCADLLDVPFANKRWSPLLASSAPEPVWKETPYLGDPNERKINVFAKKKRARSALPAARRAPGEKARVVGLAGMLRAFRSLDVDYDAFGPVFNVDGVRRFLSRDAETYSGKYDVDNAYRLMGAYVWANGLEIDPEASGSA